MAYATIAEMPVQVGRYTCMIPVVVYAMAKFVPRVPGPLIVAVAGILGASRP